MHNAKVEDKTSMFIVAANNLYYFQILLLIVLCEIWFYSSVTADQNSKVEQVFELNTEKTSIDNLNLNRESKVGQNSDWLASIKRLMSYKVFRKWPL